MHTYSASLPSELPPLRIQNTSLKRAFSAHPVSGSPHRKGEAIVDNRLCQELRVPRAWLFPP